MEQQMNVVVIGGGTGSFAVLQGLKAYPQLALTAVVTMADSGGSTGRLRDEFGYLPVGDVRMALTALAREDDEHESLLRSLFLYRFDKGEGLKGHNFGNLLLVALTDLLGNEAAAVKAAAKVLKTNGAVLPVTEQPTDLVATYEDGVRVIGEHEIDAPRADRKGKRITALSVTPQVSAYAHAVTAIQEADIIVLGPGDLYTSILANCVVDGVVEALQTTQARLLYVCNLMTKVGQTEGFSVRDHVHEVEKYIGRPIDQVLVNTQSADEALLARYAAENEFPVTCRSGDDLPIIFADLLATEEVVTAKGDVLKRSLIRHDAKKLAAAILQCIE